MVVYPNPVSGPGPVTIQVNLTQKESLVRVEIFTLAFRKVNEIDLTQVPAGITSVTIPLKDMGGIPLANGLYYIIVQTPQGRLVTKLLVLR